MIEGESFPQSTEVGTYVSQNNEVLTRIKSFMVILSDDGKAKSCLVIEFTKCTALSCVR